MPIPKKRLVFTKDSVTTEPIPQKQEKKTILTRTNTKKKIMKNLRNKSKKKITINKLKKIRGQQPLYTKSKNARYSFRKLETLIKNKRSVRKYMYIVHKCYNNPYNMTGFECFCRHFYPETFLKQNKKNRV